MSATTERIAIGLMCVSIACADLRASAQAPSEQDTVRQWIVQLDSDRFDQREEAAAKLAAAGETAIGPIVESLRGASREKMVRGLSVLVKIALTADEPTQEKAENAVKSVANGSDARAARIAAQSLDSIHQARADQTREILVSLGASTGEIRVEDVNGPWRLLDDVEFLEIGPLFRGKVEDLKRLRHLTAVESVTLALPAADDLWLKEIIAQMPQLRELNLKRAKITSAGLAEIPNLKRLNHLWICYLPVDEKGAQEFRKLPLLANLTLFGTDLPAKIEEQLNADLPNTKVDVRAGAFLGLGGAETTVGFRVSNLSRGSAAEKAGIRLDDIVQSVNGQPIASIDDLTRTLRTVKPGAKVEIEYQSGSEAKKIEVTLGEWP